MDKNTEVNQGDIYWLKPDPSRTPESNYAHPYVVIQDDVINRSRVSTVVVCALTSNLNRRTEPGNVLLDPSEANLPKQSVVVVSQVDSVAKTELGEYIGTLSAQRIAQILAGMRFQQSSFFARDGMNRPQKGAQMTQYIALFRGINVGGNNILPMKELVALLEGLGCTDVKTYIQSGNAVFSSAEEEKEKLAEAISAAIQQSHGFHPKVLLLTASELKDALAGSPFQTPEGKALHFYFLVSTPEDPNLAAMEDLKTNDEAFQLGDSVFYLYAPNGIGRSKLAEKVERLLGVPATARNLNTVNKLITMIE